MPTPTVIKQWQYSDSIPRIFWDKKYVFENWVNNPVCSAKTGGAATTTGTSVLNTRFNIFEYNIKGTQTIVAPQMVSVSSGVSALNIGMDQTENDGVELTPGILTSNPQTFLTGTDSAFFFRVRASIANVSGTDDFAIGFRKAEAYQANIDDYADMATLNTISGDIKIETIVGGAATVTTDTTDNWADGETHEIKVLVSSTGVVTYQIDGKAPTVTAAYTFTPGSYVVPFIFFLNAAAPVAGVVNILEWECGYQS